MTETTIDNTESNDLLGQIEKKLAGGGWLETAEAVELLETAETLGLGRLAERLTLEKHGKNVYYALNRHINYTNICKIGCSFCGFSRDSGQKDAYLLSPADLAEQAEQAQTAGATAVHIVGGVNADLTFEYYIDMIKAVRAKCPGLHIKAFTAVEIAQMAHAAKLSYRQVLSQLKAAGLGSLPGGGAEILCDDYFEKHCPNKPPPEKWLQVHAAAHRIGLMSNATMLYGYLETSQQRIEHMAKIRRLQDNSLKTGSGHFQCFVPLKYIEPNGQNYNKLNAIEDLKIVALSRLFLDNIPHIKAFWPMMGIKLAQVAIAFGADDLEGTVQRYKIVNGESERLENGLDPQKIEQLIRETGRRPIEHDGVYGHTRGSATAGSER